MLVLLVNLFTDPYLASILVVRLTVIKAKTRPGIEANPYYAKTVLCLSIFHNPVMHGMRLLVTENNLLELSKNYTHFRSFQTVFCTQIRNTFSRARVSYSYRRFPLSHFELPLLCKWCFSSQIAVRSSQFLYYYVPPSPYTHIHNVRELESSAYYTRSKPSSLSLHTAEAQVTCKCWVSSY